VTHLSQLIEGINLRFLFLASVCKIFLENGRIANQQAAVAPNNTKSPKVNLTFSAAGPQFAITEQAAMLVTNPTLMGDQV
jgi:hypothetical protein